MEKTMFAQTLNDKAKIDGCFDYHSQIKSRDLVFTRYAP
jgi:hypothetical protein